MVESEEELKRLLMKVKEESEKVGLKLNIQKTNIMASGPITAWEIDGETVETVSDFILGGSKITADSDCSHEIKRCLLLGREVKDWRFSLAQTNHPWFCTLPLWGMGTHISVTLFPKKGGVVTGALWGELPSGTVHLLPRTGM